MKKILLAICVLSLSGCSFLSSCFKSNLATSGRKYNSYGKGSSTTKSYSAKKAKRGKDPFASSNQNLTAEQKLQLPTHRYTKAQLSEIEKQNAKFYKSKKGGKGKFRYPYQVVSPYQVKTTKAAKTAKAGSDKGATSKKKKG